MGSHLPPNTSEHTRLNLSQTGRYSIYLPWVDLGDWLHIEMVYPYTDGHLSKY